MQLIDLTLFDEEKVVRNAKFETFGMVTDSAKGVFAPANSSVLVRQAISNPNVVAIACSRELAHLVPKHLGLCVANCPLDVIYRNHVIRYRRKDHLSNQKSQIATSAIVHPTAYVCDHDVTIGERTVVGPLAVIEANSIIGNDCVIGHGVIVGGNGFEVREIDGVRSVVPHAGGVKIGDRVELQANTSVTRSLFSGATEIGDDSATDNLVHIAHNVRIGKRCRLAAAAMIAGSTTLDDDVWIGPNATVSNGLFLGAGCQVTLGAVVIKDVPQGMKVSGNFAIEHKIFMNFFRFMRTFGGRK